jgi:hypothetical protein
MITNKTLHHLHDAWCVLMLTMLTLGGIQTSLAFTTTDRSLAYNSWKNAFYFTSNGNGYFRDQEGSGSVQYFWQFGSDMEVVEAAVALGLDTTNTVNALCAGFTNQNGLNWSWDTYNDDVMGVGRAFVGAYQLTGNRTWLTLAQSGFDLGYSRGYDSTNGGIVECTSGCVVTTETADGCIVPGYYLGQDLPNSGYTTKAQNLYKFLTNYEYIASSGMVEGTPNSGISSTSTSDYGFFMQDSVLLGHTSNAQAASAYEMSRWDVVFGNVAGSPGFCLRAMGQSGINVAWAQQACDNAWSFRNSRGIVSDWSYRVSDSVPVNTYDAMQLAMGMLAVPPINTVTLTINSAIYAPTNGANGGTNVTSLVAGKVSNNTLSLAVNNTTLGGDPSPNNVKALTIICTVGGHQETVIVPENSTANIMYATGTMVSATYLPVNGSNAGTNVLSRFGTVHGVTICNSTMGGDPAPGNAKELKMVYSVGGNSETAVVLENAELNLF